MALSKTAAIRESSGVGSISGRGTSWQVYGPYHVTNLRGPSTCINTDSYAKARRVATQWRAEVALALMGHWTDDVRSAVESHGQDYYADHSLQAYIDAGLAVATSA